MVSWIMVFFIIVGLPIKNNGKCYCHTSEEFGEHNLCSIKSETFRRHTTNVVRFVAEK